MAKGKAPADQFYWSDWLNDTELQSASASTRGVWINLLCRMWYSSTRGELTGTPDTLAKISNATKDEFNLFMEEAETLLFCYALRKPNGKITLRNRRMYKKQKDLENNRKRQQRFRERRMESEQCNGDITHLSSSSSSSSNRNTHAKACENGQKPDEKNGHFTNKVGNWKEEIEVVSERIEELFSGTLFLAKKTKRPFNVYEWIQQKANIRGHPKAILDSLNFLIKIHDAEGVENPYGFLEKTFKSLNPKYNAREHEKESRIYKQMIIEDPNMKRLLKGIG